MIKKRIISFVIAILMLLQVLPINSKNIVKADIVGESPPQVIINGKQYDATLSNCRIENGNEVYDVYVKIPDYKHVFNTPTSGESGIENYFVMIKSSESAGYNKSEDIKLKYNGKTYTGNVSKSIDVANDSSKFVDIKKDHRYKLGLYNGTAYTYNVVRPKKFDVGSYIYSKDLLPLVAKNNVSFNTKIPASSGDGTLDLGSSIVATTPSDKLSNGTQLYKLSGKTISGSSDLTKAFLFPTDCNYEITPEYMDDNGGSNPKFVAVTTTDKFSMLCQAPFFPGTFPEIEGWQWRVFPRHAGDESHSVKISDNWFLTASDTTLNDVQVTTTHENITSNWYDVSCDVYLSNGSKDNAKEAAAKLPNTITRNMYAFGRKGGIQYEIGGKTYDSVSGNPMDKSDIDKVYSNLQSKDPTLASLITEEPIGTVDFSKNDTYSDIIWIDGKAKQPVVGTTDDVAPTKSGYYLRFHGEYVYGSCDITNEIHGNVNVKQYNNAIHYAGTVSRPMQQYNLTINYIDEDTNHPITGSAIGSCEISKSYDESDLTKSNGALVGNYMPRLAPAGYTLDTSKYDDQNEGYYIGFNMASKWLPHNGRSSGNTANLTVYCKKTDEKGAVTKRYFLDGVEQKADEKELKDVAVGSHTYNADKTYSGYICSTPSVKVNVVANKIAYCDFKYTIIPPPVVEKGTVIKRYFLKGVEQTKDEEKIENVEVGQQTFSSYKIYPRYNCENHFVTVNVTANNIVYADFYYGFENHPPTVTLQAPSEVVMGDNVNVNASGVDPDADPLTYYWNTVPSDLKGSASEYTVSGYFESTGNKTYSVTVTDPYGASGSDTKVVKVVPPVPNVVIAKSGTEKENRKVTLDAEKYSSSGSSSGRYPFDWSKAKWQFFDSNGKELTVDSNPTSSTIVKSLQSTTGSKNMDLIFKKAGKYTTKCTLYNTAGYSNSFTVNLNIAPDLAPTAEYYFPDGDNVLRNPKDLSPNGLAQASHRLVDNSKSSDDNIGKRMWLACFDSDNDESYDTITNNEDGTKKAVPEKERWYVFDLDYNGDSDARYKVRIPDSTPLNGKLVTIGSDGHKYAYINDSLNPHWRYVGSYEDVLKLDINKINCGNLTSVTFKSTSVGNFDFEEVVQESFGQETISQLITNDDIKQANTFNDK